MGFVRASTFFVVQIFGFIECRTTLPFFHSIFKEDTASRLKEVVDGLMLESYEA